MGFNLIDLYLYPIYFMDLEFDCDFWDLLVRYFLIFSLKFCDLNKVLSKQLLTDHPK